MSSLDTRIGTRIRTLRGAATLDALARQAGVSRAMLSRIERGESSPTAQLLARLATGLGVSPATLFAERDGLAPLTRAARQPRWTDPASGYVRRNVSPPGMGSSVDIVEICFPPGARVGFDNRRDLGLDQHVWLLEGAMEITQDDATHALAPGDCLHVRLDQPVEFHNPGAAAARYAVIIGARA